MRYSRDCAPSLQSDPPVVGTLYSSSLRWRRLDVPLAELLVELLVALFTSCRLILASGITSCTIVAIWESSVPLGMVASVWMACVLTVIRTNICLVVKKPGERGGGRDGGGGDGGGGDGGGCGFETRAPATEWSPLCACGLRASWLQGRWWCAAGSNPADSGLEGSNPADSGEKGDAPCAGGPGVVNSGAKRLCGGCGFEQDGSALAGPAAEPTLISRREIEAETGRATAALLSAAVLGGA